MKYKLVFHTPEKYKEAIKQALFRKGAGQYANYDMCAFETKGDGQFRPLDNSKPFIGEGEIWKNLRNTELK